MGDGRLTTEPTADPLTGTELIEVTQGGLTKATTAQDIADLLQADSNAVIPPTASGEWELIEEQIASNDSELIFDLPFGSSGYRAHKLSVRGLVPQTDGTHLYIAASEDNGATYLNTSGNYYAAGGVTYDTATDTYLAEKTSTVGIKLIANCGNSTGESNDGEFTFFDWDNSSNYKTVMGLVSGLNLTPNAYAFYSAGAVRRANPIDAIKALMSSGNISSGTFRLYGLVE